MKNETAEKVKAHLRSKGFDVLGFYGSGSDPEKGWLRVWWASGWPLYNMRHGLNVVQRLPSDPALREEFQARLTAAMAELGYEQRHGVLCCWNRKAAP